MIQNPRLVTHQANKVGKQNPSHREIRGESQVSLDKQSVSVSVCLWHVPFKTSHQKAHQQQKQQHWITAESTEQHELLNQLLIYVWNQPKKKNKKNPTWYFWNSKVSHQMKLVKAQIWLSREFPAEGPLKGKDGRSQVTQLYQLSISCSLSHTQHTHTHNPSRPGFMQKQRALPGNNVSPSFLVI